MKTRTFVSSFLLLFGILFLVPASPVHGQSTGVVCIIPSGSTSCPSSPATIIGTVGAQLRVSIHIQGSGALNGFDITLLADHTIINPAGIDLTGSVLPGPQSIVQECLGGRLIVGSSCTSTDTIDTLHLAVLAAPGTITSAPTTGLLFTAIYSVTSASSGTPLRFQSGNSPSCTPSSVSGTNTCVIIANGTPTPVPETVQTAVFTTSAAADFTLTATPATLTVTRSSMATSTITLTSVSGFAGTISLSTSIAPSTSRSPTATLSGSSVTLSSGGSASVTLTVSTAKNTGFGSYTVTITGTSGTTSHSVTVTATVAH